MCDFNVFHRIEVWFYYQPRILKLNALIYILFSNTWLTLHNFLEKILKLIKVLSYDEVWSECVDDQGVHLTHWGRVTQICVSKFTIIGSDKGLSPGRHQAIIWTNAGILLIGHLGTHFSEILIGIQTFSFSKIHLKMSSAKWRLFGLGLNEFIPVFRVYWLINVWIKMYIWSTDYDIWQLMKHININ